MMPLRWSPSAVTVIVPPAAVNLTALSTRLEKTWSTRRYPGGTAPRPIKRLSSAAAKESAFSRVFAGAHFRFGLTTRQRLGPDVERFFVQNVLTPLRREDDSDADE